MKQDNFCVIIISTTTVQVKVIELFLCAESLINKISTEANEA